MGISLFGWGGHFLAPAWGSEWAPGGGAVHDAAQRHRRSRRAASWTAPSTAPWWRGRDGIW